MLRIAVIAVATLAGLGLVSAQQDLVKQRQDLMKANGKNLGGVLSATAKGDKPYDQAAITAALAQLDDTAKKLPALYADSTKDVKSTSDYAASPKVWEDKAGFAARIASFGKAVTAAQASIKDLDTLKAAVPTIGRECSGCHETYRVKL
jgi:cytochrome c556